MHSQFAQFKAGSDDGFAQMFALIQAVDMRHGLLCPDLAIHPAADIPGVIADRRF